MKKNSHNLLLNDIADTLVGIVEFEDAAVNVTNEERIGISNIIGYISRSTTSYKRLIAN